MRKTFHLWPNDVKGSHNISHDTVFSNQQTHIVYRAIQEPDITNVKWFKRKVQRPDLCTKRKTNLNIRQELNDKHFTWDSHKENIQNKAENICLRIPITSNYLGQCCNIKRLKQIINISCVRLITHNTENQITKRLKPRKYRTTSTRIWLKDREDPILVIK